MEYDIGTVYEAYKEDQDTEPKYIHPYQGSVLYQITALMERNSLVIQVFMGLFQILLKLLVPYVTDRA